MASNITVVLTVDNQQYIANLNKAEQETKGFAATGVKAGQDVSNSFDKLNTSTSVLNGHLGKLKTALLGAAFLGFARSAILTADAVNDLSDSTGMAIEKIIGFRNALTAAGGNADGASKGITTLYQNIDEARQGAASAQDAFARVGITLDDLKASDQAVFINTLEALAKMPEGAAKTAMQIALLGKEGRNVSINKEFIANLKAGEEGAVKSADAIRRAAQLNDEFTKSMEKLKLQALEAFTPIVKSVSKLLEDMPNLINLFKVLAAVIIGITVATGLRSLVGLVTGAARAVGVIGSGLSKVRDKVTGKIVKKSATPAEKAAAASGAAGGIGLAAGTAAGVAAMFGGSTETPTVKPPPPPAPDGNTVVDANAAKKASIKEVADAYLEANEKARKSIDLETDLIGLSKKEQDTRKALADILNKEDEAIKKLTKQKAGLTAEEKRAGLGGNIDAAIKKIKEQTAAEQTLMAASIASKNAGEITDSVAIAGRGRLYDITKQINDLKFNTSVTGLGELDTKIQIITKSANDWKDSTIQALANAQGISVEAFAKLYPDKVADVYKSAAQGLRELTGAARENFIAQQKINDLNFGIQQRISAEKELTQIQNEMANIGLSSIEKKYKAIDAAAVASVKSQVDAINKQLYGAQGVAEGMTIKNLDPDRYNRIVKSASASTKELKDGTGQLYAASRTFQAGWTEAFTKYVEDATNAAMQSQQLFSSITKGIEDAFIKFTETGKLSFKNMLLDITQQLIRSNIKKLMGDIFSGPGGKMSDSGSTLGSIFKSLLGFANGGIIPTNAPVIVGERGPEIISGAAGRSVTPNSALGGSVTYNINAVDAMSFKSMLAADPTFLYAVTEQGRRRLPGGM